METKKPFWTWVFCETDGTPSFSRIGTAVLIAFTCGWVSAVIYWTHHLPEFGGVAIFITVLYGTNKFTTAFQREK